MSTDYILNNTEGLVSECCGEIMWEDGDRCPACFDNCMGITPAEAFSTPKEIMLEKLKTFASPSYETSLAKGLPMEMLDTIKATFPGEFLYRYRGPSTRTFTRSPYNTIMEHATSFAIYYK
tara:strand:+ start:153 stop:515 length:363 start_codon:yes stop_codon:yes gene_type:complete